MTLTDALLNDFATRCFRDVADYDYIQARFAYRARLFSQFHWGALQAIEKYLKAILLYNRIRARDVNHDLEKALKHLKKAPFVLKLSESTLKFIEYIDMHGRFRYLEASWFIYGPKLVQFDKAVWEIRRYCDTLNTDLQLDGKTVNLLGLKIEAIEKAADRPPQAFRLSGGELEKIIEDGAHPARSMLIWQNIFFGKSRRKVASMHVPMQAINSPLTLHPELLNDVVEYVYLPKDVIKAYREELKRRRIDSEAQSARRV